MLKDLSFEVPQGSITVIIGPNGSGKTTLLKAMLGLITPNTGEVTVMGQKPHTMRKKVGYVPQRMSIDKSFPITVEEFLSFLAPDIARVKITTYLSHLNLAQLAGRLLGELSGGQFQRVLIVGSMLRDPEVFYLDEPVSGIDVGGERSFYELIAHLREEHASTVVMVSHEIDVVFTFADYVICLNQSLVCQGYPKEALTQEVLEELYGKQAAVYRHAGGDTHT